MLLVVAGVLLVAGCSEPAAPSAEPGRPTAGTAASAGSRPTPSPAPSLAGPLAGQTIVLDPGHNRDNGRHPRETGRLVDAGGFRKACNTTGASTNDGVPEAQVAWELALATRDRLVALGAEVLLTRGDGGWGPCVDARATLANSRDAALLLSIHADGAPAKAHGFHVITPGSRSGWTDDIQAPSAQAARAMRDALVKAGLATASYLGRDGIDERTDLGTLNHADVPALIVETGNLRNAADADLLTSPEGQSVVAAGLAAGVVDFLTS